MNLGIDLQIQMWIYYYNIDPFLIIPFSIEERVITKSMDNAYLATYFITNVSAWGRGYVDVGGVWFDLFNIEKKDSCISVLIVDCSDLWGLSWEMGTKKDLVLA